MDVFLSIARWLGLVLAGAGFVLSGLMLWICHMGSQSREQLRELRHALEKDPSPAQLNEARRLWPDASKLPGKYEVDDLKRRALEAEMKRANSFELSKGTLRVFLFVMGLGIALHLVGRYVPLRWFQ